MQPKGRANKATPTSNRKREARLDEALRETFPASDPIAVSVTSTEPAGRPADRKAPIIDPDDVASASRRRKDANAG